jgi:hypothetical protein
MELIGGIEKTNARFSPIIANEIGSDVATVLSWTHQGKGFNAADALAIGLVQAIKNLKVPVRHEIVQITASTRAE